MNGEVGLHTVEVKHPDQLKIVLGELDRYPMRITNRYVFDGDIVNLVTFGTDSCGKKYKRWSRYVKIIGSMFFYAKPDVLILQKQRPFDCRQWVEWRKEAEEWGFNGFGHLKQVFENGRRDGPLNPYLETEYQMVIWDPRVFKDEKPISVEEAIEALTPKEPIRHFVTAKELRGSRA